MRSYDIRSLNRDPQIANRFGGFICFICECFQALTNINIQLRVHIRCGVRFRNLISHDVLARVYLAYRQPYLCETGFAKLLGRFALWSHIRTLRSYAGTLSLQSTCLSWNVGMIPSSLALTVVVALWIGSSYAAFSASDIPTVTLDKGVFHGDIDGNANRFLRIPYAKPP